MDLALWIVGGWFGLSFAVALSLAAFIRENRGSFEAVPVRSAVRRPDRGAPRL